MNTKWHNFNCDQFMFEEHEAIVVHPDSNGNNILVVKTEYWDAFPEAIEIDLVKLGFTLCYIKNDNRWGAEADLDRKARYIDFVQKKYKLYDKCILVGMSCGGLIAIKLAAKYPELVGCMYLDAPVLNFMSCPCGFGIGRTMGIDEILEALKMDSISQLICYRDMPMDHIIDLVNSRIPIVMVAGDSDSTVPYIENGALLEKAYKDNGLCIEVYIKTNGEHHPHGLEDNTQIVDFLQKAFVTLYGGKDD